jgi:ethanolamine-phosphate phospho-lyase
MNHPDPDKSIESIIRLLEEKYEIKGWPTELVAYQDKNFRIDCEDGRKYMLKVTTNPDDLAFIESQNRVLHSFSGRPEGTRIPMPLEDKSGTAINRIVIGDIQGYARLFPFLEGRFLAEFHPDLAFYRELGRFFAGIDNGMEGQEDAVLLGRTHEWDLTRVLELADDIGLVSDPASRRLAHYFLMKYREEVLPVIHRLSKGLIHSDGNDWNILVTDDGGHVAGLIDFGDMVWAPRINELAIVLAYSMMGRVDFLEVYDAVVEGYSSLLPINPLENNVLYYTIAARWCQTLIMAARQERDNPGSTYHQVSVEGARQMLDRWIGVNPAIPAQVRTEGIDLEKRKELRYKYLSRSLSLSYRQPIQMSGAAMQYMYGTDGRTYLDCVNNIPHVGHCHPRVVEAGQRQMARLNTNTRYFYDSLEKYAEKLLSKFPPSLNKVFFVNSGSAATDLAVRLAESFTGASEYVVLDYAYHGNTKSAIQLSPYKFNRKGGRGKPANVTILPTPTTEIREPVFEMNLSGQGRTFFAESIVGCAGQVILNRGYMRKAVDAVRETGGIYVADEVQTGFGRVGDRFWAYELYDVVPDMVILGKPMGNGHPMGAVVCTGEIAASFETGMEFFSSFGGNPVSCEIGLAVLEVLEEEQLQANANRVGDYLLKELRRASGSGLIKDVRGAGLFIGIELADPLTGEPATEAAVNLVNLLRDKGILLSTDGPYNNVIKFKPPMCFSMNNAEELLFNLKPNV